FSKGTGYPTCPLSAEIAAAAHIPFRPVGTLSWLRTGGPRRRGTTIRTWGYDHFKATPPACGRWNACLSGAAAARLCRISAYDRARLRRTQEVDSGARGGDAVRHLHPARHPEERV